MIIFLLWPLRAACGILIPRPEIESMPSAVEVWSFNHWTSKEVPIDDDLNNYFSIKCNGLTMSTNSNQILTAFRYIWSSDNNSHIPISSKFSCLQLFLVLIKQYSVA